MKKVDVSFVILSFNEAEMVERAIRSIKKQKTRYAYNIFVVDNGSKDGTPKKIRSLFRDVKVIELGKNTGTAAYDPGVRKSTAKYIYFTGCDIEVREDMLDKLVNYLEKHEEYVQAAPKYISIKNKKDIDLAGTWLSKSFYSGTFKKNTLGSKIQEIPYIGTGLLRKDFIDEWGYLFDNSYFFYGEDVDLGMRIRLMGKKVAYIPDSIVYHVGSVSRRIHKPSFLTYLMERNLLKTLLTSLSPGNILLLYPYAIFMRCIAIARDILKLRFGDALARIRAILWNIIFLPKVLKKRSIVQKKRVVPDKMLLKYMTEKHLFGK